MSYKIDSDDRISFKTDVQTHTNELYSGGWYFEAITTLHASIEFTMNLIFKLYCVSKLNTKNPEKNIFIKFLPISKVLYKLEQIDEPTFDELKKFNSYRNKCAHEIFTFQIRKSQTDEWFELGTKLQNKILRISIQLATNFATQKSGQSTV